MPIKGWCMCMFKKLFNIKMKLFGNKYLPCSSKFKPSWYRFILDLFPLSIKTLPFFISISVIFSLTFLITVYEGHFLKVIQHKKRSINPNNFYLLTMLIIFDTRLSVLLSDLLFSSPFTPT